MNVTSVANDTIPLLGGKENIVSAAHCNPFTSWFCRMITKLIKRHRTSGWGKVFQCAGQIRIILVLVSSIKVYTATAVAGINKNQ